MRDGKRSNHRGGCLNPENDAHVGQGIRERFAKRVGSESIRGGQRIAPSALKSRKRSHAMPLRPAGVQRGHEEPQQTDRRRQPCRRAAKEILPKLEPACGETQGRSVARDPSKADRSHDPETNIVAQAQQNPCHARDTLPFRGAATVIAAILSSASSACSDHQPAASSPTAQSHESERPYPVALMIIRGGIAVMYVRNQ